jgi:cellulose 1,4-beta-cellobiosidase
MSGFPGGAEIMIWLDYQNTAGWQYDLGSVALGGHTWEVWEAIQTSGTTSWTYLAYLLKGPMVTSVSNLDLTAFFNDALARGYIQKSWYLYAVQAGIELRTGGVPFTNNSFSVSVQ